MIVTKCFQLVSSLWTVRMGFAVEYSPFFGIEKGAVLQEARAFHDPQLDVRRCSQVRIACTFSHFDSLYISVDEIYILTLLSSWLCFLLPVLFWILLQVITKLLYLLNQGETFTKVWYTPATQYELCSLCARVCSFKAKLFEWGEDILNYATNWTVHFYYRLRPPKSSLQ